MLLLTALVGVQKASIPTSTNFRSRLISTSRICQMSEKFRFLVDGEVAFEGRASPDEQATLKGLVKSCVCLAADTEQDRAVEGGIESWGPEVNVTHLPVRPMDPSASMGLTLALAKGIAEAGGTSEKPVLFQCTAGNRASAGALLYLAKKNDWSVEEAVAFAEENSLPCTNIPPLMNWIRMSVPYLNKPVSARLRPVWGEGVLLEGAVTPEEAAAHRAAGAQALVYLCPDEGGDTGFAAPGGFQEGLLPLFGEGHARQLPVVVTDALPANLELARALVAALEELPRPLVLQCRSANRASAPLAMYLAKKNQWTADQTQEYGEKSELPFVGVPKLAEWVRNYVESLSY
mmetsp:Transcript_24199/g.39163  ORF Transcript_24199/g.39163 Transcript_24199/m.39163 type:complete len:347 (+) Transcript_24199:32-1072(+)